MKNVIKWIFIVILVVLFAISMAGFWKYKLNGTRYVIEAGTDESQDVGDVGLEEIEPEIEYAELQSSDFENGEQLFITDIDKEDDETYTIKGLIYEVCEITKEEYNNLKNGKETVTILDVEYEKDTIKSNNLILKAVEESDDAKEIYVKYDSTTKKYLVKDTATDYTVYKQTEKYVKYNVDQTQTITVEKGTKTEKKQIEDLVDEYTNIQLTDDLVKIDLAEFTFNKQGTCTSIKIEKK